MSTGAAIALGVGAVVLALFVTRMQQKASTPPPPPKSSEPYALSIQDHIAIGGTILGYYFGGPSGGKAASDLLVPA